MCGIFGFYKTSPQSLERNRADLLTGLDKISYRGPDGKGHWIDDAGQIGLGHVRLTIIDVESGAQPMHTNCGRYTIVYNGEIYNYLELRHILGAKNFSTSSDTEVVLRAFELWGVDCVTRFRGMFAIVIWDAKERQLFLHVIALELSLFTGLIPLMGYIFPLK